MCSRLGYAIGRYQAQRTMLMFDTISTIGAGSTETSRETACLPAWWYSPIRWVPDTNFYQRASRTIAGDLPRYALLDTST